MIFGVYRKLVDPGLGPLLSSSTMVFAPNLDFKPLFEYIYTVRPSLYLGSDFMGSIADNWAVSWHISVEQLFD